MKKTAIALALAGLVAGPSIAAADTTVYGSIRLSERYTDADRFAWVPGGGVLGGAAGQECVNSNTLPDDPVTGQPIVNPNAAAFVVLPDGTSQVRAANVVCDDDSFWDMVNDSSRLGFKGSEDLGNGQSVVYQYEFGVNAPDGPTIGGARNRLAYVGFKGGWGQATFGTQWNPFYFAVGGEVDVWGDAFTGAGGYYGNRGFTRSNNMLVYATPSFNGLTGYAAVETDGQNGDTGADRYQLAAIYDNGPLFIGAAWRRTSEDAAQGIAASDLGGSPTAVLLSQQIKAIDQYGVSARYNFSFGLGLAASWNQYNQDKGLTTNGYDLLASWTFGRTTIRGSYYQVDDDNTTIAVPLTNTDPSLNGVAAVGLKQDKQKGYTLGVQHRFSRRTRVWVEGGSTDNDGTKQDASFVSVGMRHDF